MDVGEKWWTSLKMLFLLDRPFLLSISCRKRFNYHVDGCSLVRNGCWRELSLGKNVDFAGRTADIQYATGWIRRDLTSSLALGLSYRLFIWAALFLVISRLKSSHNYLTNFQNRYDHYGTIKVIFKFRPFIPFIFWFSITYILLISLFIFIIIHYYYLNVHTLKVSRKGLNWSQDISELVDDPYQATWAWGPDEVPSSLQDTVILSTCT